MFVSDLVTEIFAVTLLGISGLDEINYNVPPFLYAVNNALIPMLARPSSALIFLLAQIAPFLVTTILPLLGNEKMEFGHMMGRAAVMR